MVQGGKNSDDSDSDWDSLAVPPDASDARNLANSRGVESPTLKEHRPGKLHQLPLESSLNFLLRLYNYIYCMYSITQTKNNPNR